MTPKRKKLLLRIGAILTGLLLVLIITSIVVLRSSWFAGYVREKLIATVEESTGGRVDIGSFEFDWSHLTVRIRNFVLHGTEPAGNDPLLRASLLEVHLKLLTGLKQVVDLEYLGIERPQANVIVFPDGKTNIPEPKVPSKPSNTSGLETVVDLAVHKFEITNGLLQFSQRKTAFQSRGENLHVQLLYNVASPRYQGNVSLDPLLLTSGTRPPLRMHVNLPLVIEKDAIRLNAGRFTTDRSQITIDAGVERMKAPVISARLNGNISLAEIQQSIDLPIDANGKGTPNTLSLEAAVHMDNERISLEAAHIGLGKTTFEASGVLRDSSQKTSAQFKGRLALAELTRLLKVTSPQPNGEIDINGNARLDAQSNYFVDGDIHSKDLAIRSGDMNLSNINLSTPFHADPFLISLDGLKLNALGGGLSAKIFVEKMQRLSVEGNLRDFSLQVLTHVLEGKRIGYDGTLSGSVKAQGDLKAKGTAGYQAQARLLITPGNHGVPVTGRINADYQGASSTVTLGDSYVALPSTRLTLSGALNKRIDVQFLSKNLNDLFPAVVFASSGKPPTALPVTLQGGTASLQAQITGNLSAPQITSHLDMSQFAVEQRSFDRFAVDLVASSSGASVRNGLLTRKTLQTNFDAAIGLQKWSPLPSSPLTANVALHNGDLADVLSLAGAASIPATGDLNADVHVNGSYGNPLGSATVQVLNGSAYQEPFDRFYTKVDLGDRLITLSTLELAAGSARVNVNGSFAHPANSFMVGHAQLHVATSNVQLANLKTIQKQNQGVAGLIQLTADAAADLREVNKQSEFSISNIMADFSGRGLRVQNQDAGDLVATARTESGAVVYKVDSNFAGSAINVNGRTTLAVDYSTTADASIQHLSIEKTLKLVGQADVPALGNFSANAHVAGTARAPNADLTFLLANADVYSEAINRLQGSVHYSNTLVDVPSLELDVPAGRLTLAASFSHPANNFNNGDVKVRVNSNDVQLAKIKHLEQVEPGLAGTFHLAADLSANLRQSQVLVQSLNADASTSSLRLNRLPLGDANFKAQTTGSNLNFTLDSNIAQSQIHGSGQTQLTADYPSRANVTFANIRYSNLTPFISKDPAVRPDFDGLVEGQVSVNGPITRTDDLVGQLQLSRLEAMTTPRGTVTGGPRGKAVTLHNEGPIVVALDHSRVQIKQAHLQGPQTDINASGDVDLKDPNAPLHLALNANANLGLLQDIDRDIYSSGAVVLQAAVRGNFNQPLVNGRIELKNANVNMADAPNGLSNGNGVILLNGTSASIQSLTGESGGGKIAVNGFVGLTGTTVNYNLHATATRVRTRYSGVSLTSSAAINLTGTADHSLLDGRVILQRLAYQSDSDLGSILSNTSTPVSTPTAPSTLLAGMKLDIRITTAPDLRVVTTYAERLHVEADLRLRGTGATPGMVGHVAVTEGTLIFFGNEYTVDQGTVTFYDPNRITPVLNVDLETSAQGVDVTIGLKGPIDNLKLSYRSDPPLRFEEIVELLATNKTPSDPTIAAHQPAPAQQSFSQMGESAVVGQAVASPLSSRVQRVFGVSQFKIDPTFSGNSGIPQARVTLKQQVTNNVTFSYITDVTQTNSQIIRVEWAFTPKFSAVAMRDENGAVSVDFFYKRKIR
jgi:translocation and assembly module TamB